MIEIPISPHYDKNNRGVSSDNGAYPCVVCGKIVRRPRYYVHVHNGGNHVVTEEEAAVLDDEDRRERVSSDLGWFPLGSDCLRSHPELRPYVHKAGDPAGEESKP